MFQFLKKRKKKKHIKHPQPAGFKPSQLKYWIEQEGKDFVLRGSDEQDEHEMFRSTERARVYAELAGYKTLAQEQGDILLAEGVDFFTIKFPQRYLNQIEL